MKTLITIVTMLIGISSVSFAAGISHTQIPFNNKIENAKLDGKVVVDLNTSASNIKIGKDFYGADTNGFSRYPNSQDVLSLQLGYVKMGGNFHSVYNWNLNAFLNFIDDKIEFVFWPLAKRLRYIQQEYSATPMFQVNMLGWQPDYDTTNNVIFVKSATAVHAASALTYINGQEKIGLKHVLMGNEPFDYMDTYGIPTPTADEYINSYIQYAMALREAHERNGGVPEDLKLWGPEIATGWTLWQTNHPNDCVINYELPEIAKCSYGNGQFTDFIPYFLNKITEFENNRNLNPKGYKMLDYLTLHYYPLFRKEFQDKASIITDKAGRQNVPGMLESVNLWTSMDYINSYDSASPKGLNPKIINRYQAWKEQYYPSAKLAVTEFGVDSVENVEYHPIVRPLYLADLMARIGEKGVETFVNSFLQGVDTLDTWGLINNNKKTNLYFVYSLYSNFYIGNVLKTNDTYKDLVNVYSVKTDTGTNIFLVNKDAKVHNTSLSFMNLTEKNIGEISLPAWSLTVLKVPNAEGQIEVYQFGAKEMNIPVETYYASEDK